MKSLACVQSLFSNRKAQISLMILLFSLNSLVFILPYLIKGYTIPVGWDTAWYIRNMRLIEEQGLLSLFTETHGINLFCILEYTFASIFNISFTLTTIIVPIMMGLLFPLVSFRIVEGLTRSRKLAFVAMLFTIIDYNTVRLIGLLPRNLFCFLLIQVAVFLVLPGFLAKPSKKRFFILILLLVIAGLSQKETFAVSVIMLFISLIFFLRKGLAKTARLLLLCVLTSISIVILFEAPFIPMYIQGAIFFNPTVRWYRQNFVAGPWSYLLHLGTSLLIFYAVGLYELRQKIKGDLQEYQYLFVLLWNIIVIAGSFLPVFGVRVPGWRFLLMATIPPVAAVGFEKLFLRKSSFTKKKTLALIFLLIVGLIVIVMTQSRTYKPWISKDNYERLMWISNASQNNPNVIFVLSFDAGTNSFEWAELYRRWIWSVIGTRTNVYFGDIDMLLQSNPTNFENSYLNSTSHILWNDLENLTLERADIYLIEEWYELSLSDEKLETVALGIYRVKH